MVKTVTLTADTPQKITFEGAYPYYWINNKSTSDIYASVGGTPEADADDTYTIAAGSQLRISGGVGNDGITLLGEGKVQIIASTIAACPFKTASGGGDANAKYIDGVPVDLTGMYNTQVIGYDEASSKLVPMSAVAKTQIVLPSTETPCIWELTEADSQVVSGNYPYPRYIFQDAGTAIITFKYPFMLSEFNTINATVNRQGEYYSYKIIFSKKPDFATIDAEYIISKADSGTLNIASLYGKYYIRSLVLYTRARFTPLLKQQRSDPQLGGS